MLTPTLGDAVSSNGNFSVVPGLEPDGNGGWRIVTYYVINSDGDIVFGPDELGPCEAAMDTEAEKEEQPGAPGL